MSASVPDACPVPPAGIEPGGGAGDGLALIHAVRFVALHQLPLHSVSRRLGELRTTLGRSYMVCSLPLVRIVTS
jgi:hypothetical protein